MAGKEETRGTKAGRAVGRWQCRTVPAGEVVGCRLCPARATAGTGWPQLHLHGQLINWGTEKKAQLVPDILQQLWEGGSGCN